MLVENDASVAKSIVQASNFKNFRLSDILDRSQSKLKWFTDIVTAFQIQRSKHIEIHQTTGSQTPLRTPYCCNEATSFTRRKVNK